MNPLSINGAYWTISAYMNAKILPEPTAAGSGAVCCNGHSSSSTRSTEAWSHRIDSPEKLFNNVMCAHDGEFTALTTDKNTGRLETVTGSVPR